MPINLAANFIKHLFNQAGAWVLVFLAVAFAYRAYRQRRNEAAEQDAMSEREEHDEVA